MIRPRIELGTFCVLSRCHDQLDHRTNLLFVKICTTIQNKERITRHLLLNTKNNVKF
mgnify:CR=1 FL=1